LFSGIVILVAVSTPTLANAVDPPPRFDLTVDLIFPNFPLNGLLLLGMYFLFTLFGGPVKPEGYIRYIILTLFSVCLITFSGALIDTVAFLEDDTRVYLASASLIGIIVIGICYRYLRMELVFSLLAGFVFFAYNYVTWALLDDWFWTLVDYYAFFTVLFIIFWSVLIFVAYWFHGRPLRELETRGVVEDAVEPSDKRDPIVREWIKDHWYTVEALSISMVLLSVAVYISINPIFRFPE
jgi:hypothetical protein